MLDYLVSILVPVYNVEHYIERCAISLFEQTYNNIEYIFVDDCSPDKSIQILEEIISRYPSRQECIKIIRHQKNRGLAAARNTAVATANGDFIIHVDSDDYLDKRALELLVKKQSENNADIVKCDITAYTPYYTRRLKTARTTSAKELCLQTISRKNIVFVCGGLIRRSLYSENDVHCIEGVNFGEDYQVSPRLAYYAKNVNYVKQSLYFYDCCNENSYTFSYSPEKYAQNRKSYEIIRDFVSDKTQQLRDAYMCAESMWYIRALKTFALIEGDHQKEYHDALKIIRQIPVRYHQTTPFRHRILIYISNYWIARKYMSFIRFMGFTIRHK